MLAKRTTLILLPFLLLLLVQVKGAFVDTQLPEESEWISLHNKDFHGKLSYKGRISGIHSARQCGKRAKSPSQGSMIAVWDSGSQECKLMSTDLDIDAVVHLPLRSEADSGVPFAHGFSFMEHDHKIVPEEWFEKEKVLRQVEWSSDCDVVISTLRGDSPTLYCKKFPHCVGSVVMIRVNVDEKELRHRTKGKKKNRRKSERHEKQECGAGDSSCSNNSDSCDKSERRRGKSECRDSSNSCDESDCSDGRSECRDDRSGCRDDRSGCRDDRSGCRDDRSGCRDDRSGCRDDCGSERKRADYTVKPGDTLAEIAKRHHMSWEEFLALNPTPPHHNNYNDIYPGDIVCVYRKKSRHSRKKTHDRLITSRGYKVQKGDTLYGISRKFKMSLRQLMLLNPTISNCDANEIYPGDFVCVEDGCCESDLEEMRHSKRGH